MLCSSSSSSSSSQKANHRDGPGGGGGGGDAQQQDDDVTAAAAGEHKTDRENHHHAAAAAATASSSSSAAAEGSSSSRAGSSRTVKFVPLSSCIEPSFWVRYCREKLETIRLREDPVPVRASYCVVSSRRAVQQQQQQQPPRLQLSEAGLVSLFVQSGNNSSNEDDGGGDGGGGGGGGGSAVAEAAAAAAAAVMNNDTVSCRGTLIGFNTVEAFQKVDKNRLLLEHSPFGGFSSSAIEDDKEKDTEEKRDADDADTAVLDALTSFVLLAYADLKNHKVLYWMGVPAVLPVRDKSATAVGGCSLLGDVWTDREHAALVRQIHDMRLRLYKKAVAAAAAAGGGRAAATTASAGLPPYFVRTAAAGCQSLAEYVSEKRKKNDDDGNENDEDDVLLFGFFDPVNSTTATAPSMQQQQQQQQQPPVMGWPLRNLVAYLSLRMRLGGRTVSVLSCRPKRLRRIVAADSDDNSSSGCAYDGDGSEFDESVLFSVRVPAAGDYRWPPPPPPDEETKETKGDDCGGNGNSDSSNNNKGSGGNRRNECCYRAVGWELNARSKPGPRWTDLSPLLDERHLAVQAADLNLKLMKWRMIPALAVTELRELRALLLGAGTLGCGVARTLLGWGVRNFHIVDYGTVSYSNPVRQSLFTLRDCRRNDDDSKKSGGGGSSGKPKAEAAAAALRTIAADVNAAATRLSIPMPGHAERRDDVERSVAALDRLVRECDVVFLLTDTRESRWLPTVAAAAHGKMLINAALGLDSWLVMRHGGGIGHAGAAGAGAAAGSGGCRVVDSSSSSSGKSSGGRLGCYFCNDIVAPENSTRNRTLDQQCTVTRPGLAPIAASMAAEMAVSLLHHPAGAAAPAPAAAAAQYSPAARRDGTGDGDGGGGGSSPLGIIPHQVRGSLATYTVMTPAVPAFEHCTACSEPVVQAYRADPVDLVAKACCNATTMYLQDLSGLTAYNEAAHAKMQDMMTAMEQDDDDDDDDWE